MKRIVFRLAVALLTFALGVTALMTWRNLRTLPYCEMARNAGQYHGKVVSVRATLIFGSDGMYVYEDCDPVSALASLVELEGSKSDNPIARDYVQEVLVSGEKDSVKKVDAVITGLFDGEYSRGCWLPQFHIKATSIELKSPVSNYSPVPSNTRIQRRAINVKDKKQANGESAAIRC